MKIIVPIPVTDAMILAGTTVAEPAAGETAWTSGGTYAIGDLRIRSTTHKAYACVQAHSGRTALPEVDAAYWLEKSPTQRWAPFDTYASTRMVQAGPISYVLKPGYFNAVALYGLSGNTATVTVHDTPGGSVIYTETKSLYADPAGWYEYLFGRQRPVDKLLFTDIPIRPTATVTITLAGTAVELGMIVVGDYRSLLDDAQWGGTEQGARAEPVTYSYIKTEDDGTVTIKRRHAATSMRASVIMPREFGDQAVAAVQEVLDTPTAWIATDAAGFTSLNVFGLGSASLDYTSSVHARMDVTVKGLI